MPPPPRQFANCFWLVSLGAWAEGQACADPIFYYQFILYLFCDHFTNFKILINMFHRLIFNFLVTPSPHMPCSVTTGPWALAWVQYAYTSSFVSILTYQIQFKWLFLCWWLLMKLDNLVDVSAISFNFIFRKQNVFFFTLRHGSYMIMLNSQLLFWLCGCFESMSLLKFHWYRIPWAFWRFPGPEIASFRSF